MNKTVKRIRRLGKALTVVTVIVVLFSLAMSLVPKEASGAMSDWMADIIKSTLHIGEKKPQPKEIFFYSPEDYVFYGTTFAPRIYTIPYDADKSYELTFADTERFVDNGDGTFTYVGTEIGNMDAKIKSLSAPNVENDGIIIVKGISPADERIEKLEVAFVDHSWTEDATPHDSLDVNKNYYVKILATPKKGYEEELGLEEGVEKIPLNSSYYELIAEENAENVIFDKDRRTVRFDRELEGLKARVRFFKNETDFLTDGEGEEIAVDIVVSSAVNPDNDYIPTEPLIPTVYGEDNSIEKVSDDEYTMTLGEGYSAISLSSKSVKDVNTDFYLVAEEGEESHFTIENKTIYRKGNGYTGVVWMVSLLDETVRTKINVVQLPTEPPSGMELYGPSRLSLDHTDVKYSVQFDDKVYDMNDVTWSIVQGEGLAEIDEEGNLTVIGMGMVTVRATSVYFDVYAEKTVNISFFSDFRIFIRKSIGHLLLFIAIGFLVMLTHYFLMRKKGVSVLVSILAVVVLAFVSEGLQLPIFSEGRGASIADVCLDSLGGFLGIAIAVSLLGIVNLVKKRKNKEKYLLYKKCLAEAAVKKRVKSAHPPAPKGGRIVYMTGTELNEKNAERAKKDIFDMFS